MTITGTSDQNWVNVTGASLTIKDDDTLDTPDMSLAEGANHTSVTVTWAAVTGATGYKLEWKLSTNTTWTSVSSPSSPVTITGLTHNLVYDIRLAATKTGYDDSDWDTETISPGEDYDADDDGLIEITTLAQLNAVRWDLDGDGSSTNAGYATAFPLAHVGMGCNEDETTPSNRVCEGYELRANLDFNTNDSEATSTNPTGADSGDTYWNSGSGWLPIGDVTGTAYLAIFDGNADRDASGDGGPYTISNLFINRTSGSYAGLFGHLQNGEAWNVGIENADITLTTSSSGHVYVGGLAGRISSTGFGVIVDGGYTTGEISSTATITAASKHLYVGGLAGTLEDGETISSYSWADVTAVAQGTQSGTYTFAGGLFGAVGEHAQNAAAAEVNASYAAGSVSATAPGGSGRHAQAGGLAGQLSPNSTIRVSYARGSVTASSGSNAYEGGLVGYQRGNIEYSFATGAVAHSESFTGGLVGSRQTGTTTASYYNSETDGRTDRGQGTAKTTSELQTPTAYGTGTSIYKDWDLDLDSVTPGTQDAWDFGTANQYPALKYGSLTAADQRPVISLTLNPSTIYESVGGATTSTVTASSTREWNRLLTVAVPQEAARYTVSDIAIAEGSNSGTQTLTAINNKTDAAHFVKTLLLDVHPAKMGSTTTTDTWVSRGTVHPTLTINDDDELAKPTGLKLSVDGTKIQADWTQVTGATGYRVEWNTANSGWGNISPTQKANVTGGSTVTYKIDPTPALTANTRYYVRVIATKATADDSVPSDVADTKTTTATPGAGDYDVDNDGLIEVDTLAKLNAIRWDLDGNGVPVSGKTTEYAAAFPNAEDNMGCNESGATISSGPGNPACSGYELSANLDFDDNTAGDRTDDTYYNSGAGWQPIGDAGTAFTGEFHGTGYTISNLAIDRDSTTTDSKYYAGLFGRIDSGAVIIDVALEGVSVTLESTASENPQPEVYAGGLVGYQKAGNIAGSYVVGTVKAVVKASTHNAKPAYAGGLVGYKEAGTIISSYADATVTAEHKDDAGTLNAYAGGLVGYHKAGDLLASYTIGSVAAKVSSTNGKAYAGGLVGEHKGGDIKASYSYAAVKAENDGGSNTGVTLTAGGLVGLQSGGNITASYSTGAPTLDKDGATVTERTGGLVGHRTSGTTTDGYWDTDESGITATGQGTGKTTTQLQTPTAYGTGSNDIYKDWDIDLDPDTSGTQDPWNFGTASQYPVLKYGLTVTDQRRTLTISASPTTIWERALTTPSRVNAATVTVTLDKAVTNALVVTLPTGTAYTLSASTVTIAGGSTSGTVTLTAVNNFVDAANKAINLKTAGASVDDVRVEITSANPTLTINDDDEFSKPTGLKLSVDGTKIQADWTAVANVDGYRIEWNATTNSFASPTGNATVTAVGLTGDPPTTYTISGLTANTRYYVRVLPTKSGVDEPPSDVVDTMTRASAGTGDYDADNDGLIEVTTLAQLNAIRWDLDGNGVPVSGKTTEYAAAFPNAEDNMGCNENVASITAGPGNPACSGYELSANLDFDTDNSGGPNMGDTYYNSGAGWTPIGDGTTAYTGDFDGNNDSDSTGDGGPYTITNLHVNASSTSGTSYAGLFGVIGSGADVDNVALTKVSVTGSTTGDAVYAGALAGKSSGTITESWSLGAVAAKRTGTGTDKTAYAGGLVGWNDGTIRGAYSRAAVTAESHDGNEGYAGGLVGLNDTGDSIAASYAAGSVTANRGTDTTGAPDNDSHAGGLAAVNKGTITASYAIGDGTAVGKNTDMGGLVAENASGATITASYSLGKQTATATGGTATTGGFAGSNSGTITDSYWDTATSGIADDTGNAAPEGKTTSELQTPTTETGIYANWDVNVDGVPGNDDPWDFGTASQYPVLDFGSHVLNKQRNTVTITASPTAIWERADTGLSRINTSGLSAALGHAWEDDLTVTLPSAVAGLYTLSGTTISIAAGSTTGTATVTLTAVDDTVDQTLPDSRTASFSAASVDSYVVARVLSPVSGNIAILDDDNVAKVTGVKLSVDGTKIRVDWTQAAGAGGYTVQWHTSDSWASPTGTATKTGGSTVTHRVSTGLTANTTYYFRVIATKTGQLDAPPSDVVSTTTTSSAGTGDYDADNDGLIEITTLAQLNAVRWDLDGNGAVDNATDQTSYDTAFPNAEDNMGCNESVVTISSGTGNLPCTGYELSANLDFDTNSSGGPNMGDTYWNGGQGWLPIGATAGSTASSAYTGDFEGGTYTISNLYINRSGSMTVAHGGLFAQLGSGADVKDLSLEGVSITVATNATESTPADVYAGGIAGKSSGSITDSYVLGAVKAVQSENTANNNERHAYAGGLVGQNTGSVTSSYSRADVTAEQKSTTASLSAYAGGIAGRQDTGGSITASFSTGAIVADSRSATGAAPYAGGLLGYQNAGSVKAVYSPRLRRGQDLHAGGNGNPHRRRSGGARAGREHHRLLLHGRAHNHGRRGAHRPQGRAGGPQERHRDDGDGRLLGIRTRRGSRPPARARARPPASCRRPRPTGRGPTTYTRTGTWTWTRRRRGRRTRGTSARRPITRS